MTMVFFQIGEFWVASDHVGSTLQRDRLCHTNLFWVSASGKWRPTSIGPTASNLTPAPLTPGDRLWWCVDRIPTLYWIKWDAVYHPIPGVNNSDPKVNNWPIEGRIGQPSWHTEINGSPEKYSPHARFSTPISGVSPRSDHHLHLLLAIENFPAALGLYGDGFQIWWWPEKNICMSVFIIHIYIYMYICTLPCIYYYRVYIYVYIMSSRKWPSAMKWCTRFHIAK